MRLRRCRTRSAVPVALAYSRAIASGEKRAALRTPARETRVRSAADLRRASVIAPSSDRLRASNTSSSMSPPKTPNAARNAAQSRAMVGTPVASALVRRCTVWLVGRHTTRRSYKEKRSAKRRPVPPGRDIASRADETLMLSCAANSRARRASLCNRKQSKWTPGGSAPCKSSQNWGSSSLCS